MTVSTIARSVSGDSREAGRELGEQILQGLGGRSPDAVLLTVSRPHDHRALLESLHRTCRPGTLVGGTAVGGFTRTDSLEGAVCAVALSSPEMRFSAAVGQGLRASREVTAAQLVAGLHGLTERRFPHRSAIVFIDARAIYAEHFIEELTVRTAGTYQLFGGGATDDPLVSDAHVFVGQEVLSDAAVALEILSDKPLAVGVFHGWQPSSQAYRVTESDGRRLVSLNAQPTLEIFEEHAQRTGQTFDPARPMPFFLGNILGIQQGRSHKLRVPLEVLPDGSVVCANEIPLDSTVHLMSTSTASAADAALQAVRGVRQQLGDLRPGLALFFDCLAAKVRMQLGFGFDLRLLEEALGTRTYAGFGTAGQIARADGQFNGFHNSTSVVCVFPE